jgi:hypothetical protein
MYKLNQVIKVYYRAVGGITGIVDLQFIPTNPSGVDQTVVNLTEVSGNAGLYYGTFTPNALGRWWIRVKSITNSENVYAESYLVGNEENPEDLTNTKIGEVQASPTANTLLGRLKDIWDKLVELFNPITGTAKVKLWDGTSTLEIDNKVPAIVSTCIVHYKTHEGLFFNFLDYATGIANGANRDILLITSTKDVHLRLSISSIGTATIFIYEAPTTTANGTEIPSYNMDRNSTNTSITTAYYTPTVTAVGTMLKAYFIAISKQFFWGENEEIILKQSTKYLIRFASTAGSNGVATLLSFYEV